MLSYFADSPLYTYLIIPLFIFFARICDVTIGTIRIIFVSKGNKNIAPLLGFFEVFIWVLAISQIMANLNNFVCYIGYAAGFATGNYVGMLVEEKIAVGKFFVRMITSDNPEKLMKLLGNNGFGATAVNAKGSQGDVTIVYTVINRKKINKLQSIMAEFNKNLFYTIEDIRKVNAGFFPDSLTTNVSAFKHWRKGK